MTQELIEGKTLREIAEMPMMEARKLMRESGHRWFGAIHRLLQQEKKK